MKILTQLVQWQVWLSDNFDLMRRDAWWSDNFDSPGFFCSWTISTQWQFWLSCWCDNFDSVGTVTISAQWQFWLDASWLVVMWQFRLTWFLLQFLSQFLLQLDNFDSVTILTQLTQWQSFTYRFAAKHGKLSNSLNNGPTRLRLRLWTGNVFV